VNTSYADCLRLAWSWERVIEESRVNPKTKGISLFKGNHDYVDICSAYFEYDRAYLGLLYYPEEYKSILKLPGKYRITISIVGDNADPRRICVILIWKGIWNEAKIMTEDQFKIFGHQFTDAN
jgi:hypothetical protein